MPWLVKHTNCLPTVTMVSIYLFLSVLVAEGNLSPPIQATDPGYFSLFSFHHVGM